MEFTWIPIKNLDNLPVGEFIMMSDGRNVDYVRRGDVNCSENKDDWYYCYTDRIVQNPKRFQHYFIPRPALNNKDEKIK